MLQHRVRHAAYVVRQHEAPPIEEGPRLRNPVQGDAAARGGSQPHVGMLAGGAWLPGVASLPDVTPDTGPFRLRLPRLRFLA